jgi:hypothetical protein
MRDLGEYLGEERGWEAGEYDKASSSGNAWILIGYTVVFLLLAVLAPGFICSSIAVLALLVGLWLLLAVMFLMGRFSGRDVTVQRRKFFDMGPDRLSRVVERVLRDLGVRADRAGPSEREPDIYTDSFSLVNHPWKGIVVIVQRDGLIARESPCQVTVQCGERKDPLLESLQERIDRAAEVERETGEESREWRVYPKYVTPPY